MFGCSNPTLVNNLQNPISNKVNMKNDNIKRLYEESVMVRKVRHYLKNLTKNIERNEERLRLISSSLEHSAINSNTLRRRPSPSHSHAGSISSITGLNNSHYNSHNLSNGSTVTPSNGLNNKSNLFGKLTYFS
jgi:hypothetical protein